MTTNPMQRKQLVFRAKALAMRLQALRKKLESPYLNEKDVTELKAELVEVRARYKELGLDDAGMADDSLDA